MPYAAGKTAVSGATRAAPLAALVAAMLIGGLGDTGMPILVGAVIEGLGLDEAGAGILATTEAVSMAAASLLLAPRMANLPRGRLAMAGASATALFYAIAAATTGFAPLLVLRAAAGIAEGCTLAAFNASVAADRDPDKLYARVEIWTTLIAAGGLAVLPLVVRMASHQQVFLAFAAVALVGVPLLRSLPERDTTLAGGDAPVERLSIDGRLVALIAASFVFSLGDGAVWAFTERLGVAAGLTSADVSRVLGVTGVLGLIGSFVAVRIGTRYGRVLPLSAGLAATAAASFAVTQATTPLAFIAAQLVWAIAYLFSMPFVFGVGAALDPGGRVATAAAGAAILGAAIGPALGGVLVSGSSPLGLGALVAVTAIAAAALMLPVAMRIDAA